MKMTIAELRKIEAGKLAAFGDGDLDKAVSLMNAFYRFCGLNERVFYLENDERLHNSAYTKELENTLDRRYKALEKRFNEYGLTLVYCGFLPSIGVKCEHGGFSEKINRWFYD